MERDRSAIPSATPTKFGVADATEPMAMIHDDPPHMQMLVNCHGANPALTYSIAVGDRKHQLKIEAAMSTDYIKYAKA